MLMTAVIHSMIISLRKVRYKIASNPYNNPTGQFISFLLPKKKTKNKKRGWETWDSDRDHVCLQGPHPPAPLTRWAQELFAWESDRFPSSCLFKQTRWDQWNIPETFPAAQVSSKVYFFSLSKSNADGFPFSNLAQPTLSLTHRMKYTHSPRSP